MKVKIPIDDSLVESVSQSDAPTLVLSSRFVDEVGAKHGWAPDELEWLESDPQFQDRIIDLWIARQSEIRDPTVKTKPLVLDVPEPPTRDGTGRFGRFLPFGNS
jgi:hypothetical protein